MKITNTKPCYDNQLLGQDMNPGLFNYKAGVLNTW